MRLERRGGIIEVALATEMTVAMGTIETLDQSMRLGARGGIIEVALATQMSRVTTCSCAVDGLNLTVVFEAVHTPPSGGPSAADRHFKRRAGPGRKVLDVAKNRIWSRYQRCELTAPKTDPSGCAFRHGDFPPCRGIHYRFGDSRDARLVDAPRTPGRYHRSCPGNRDDRRHGHHRDARPVDAARSPRRDHRSRSGHPDVSCHDLFVRSGWSSVNGRDCIRRGPSEDRWGSCTRR